MPTIRPLIVLTIQCDDLNIADENYENLADTMRTHKQEKHNEWQGFINMKITPAGN